MNSLHCKTTLLGYLLLLLGGAAAWAIPAQMNISGRLLDNNGAPVYYTAQGTYGPYQIEVSLPAKIRFYDSATTTTAFHTMAATARAFDAYFNISFNLPEAAVVKDSLWYVLSIDVDRNGLTSADDFPDRFEIGSVPFALSAKPQTAFTTHGGWTYAGGGFSANIFATNPQDKMMAVPFETPPGGVEFNQMNVILNEGWGGSAFSFGIYDKNGKLVVSSGRITIPGASNDTLRDAFLQVRCNKIKLQPSTIYYTGLSTNNKQNVFPNGMRPVAATWGIVSIPPANGLVPTAFDPSKVEQFVYAVAMPISLTLNTASAKPEGGWSSAKPGQPQYRWLMSKFSQPK